jgi:hypothetical protein
MIFLRSSSRCYFSIVQLATSHFAMASKIRQSEEHSGPVIDPLKFYTSCLDVYTHEHAVRPRKMQRSAIEFGV